MKLKSIYLASALVLAGCTSISALAQATEEKPSNSLVENGAKSRGTTPTITNKDNGINDPKTLRKAPPSKSNEKARGVFSAIKVDNRTALYIKIYVDDRYEGTVGPWGDFYCMTVDGRTKLYATADFTDGSQVTFGPRVRDINGVFTWTLNY